MASALSTYGIEEMSTMSQDVLIHIAQLPPIWKKWDNDKELFLLLGPKECKTLQLLLYKKLDEVSAFYDRQLANAAALRRKTEEEER